jgi:hypothetical protein
MARTNDRPLFSYLVKPAYQMKSPDMILSEGDFDLLRITVDDFRFVTREITNQLAEVAADIRSRSTILRRLLSEGDLFNAGRLYPPRSDLRVIARVLDFNPMHPSVLISCGNYPWAGDRLPGTAIMFSLQGVQPLISSTWQYRDNADVSLSEYLDGLALAVLGTSVRRREVVKYVANKKAAHVSERRKNLSEQAIDSAWSHLFITIVEQPSGHRVVLNLVYLEILSVIEALATSASIGPYIDDLDRWLMSAKPVFPEALKSMALTMPVSPIARP